MQKLMTPSPLLPITWQTISGTQHILRIKPALKALAARCGQTGSLDFLEYFLAAPYFDLDVPEPLGRAFRFVPREALMQRAKRPVLLIRSLDSEIVGAVLLFEYKLTSLPTRCFVPLDDDGYRCVIAPPQQKSEVALEAGAYLVKRGALLVLISSLDPLPEPEPASQPSTLLGYQSRPVARRLRLQPTFEQTLAAMSRNTRHNLRRSRTQLLQTSGASYIPNANPNLQELLELNRSCTFTVPDWAAQERCAFSRDPVLGLLAGLRDSDGNWLSLMGAHREEDTLCLDWQMNRSGFGSISVATAMRAFLFEDEVHRGTHWVRFERGTTHPLQGAFLTETTHDWLFAPAFIPARLIRHLTQGAKGGALATVLASPSLVWRT